MDNSEINRLHNQYFEAVKQLQSKNDIIANLPRPDYESFFVIMNKLLKFIEKEIEETQALISIEDDHVAIERGNEELRLWMYKLGVCTKYLNDANKKKSVEALAPLVPEKVLFLLRLQVEMYIWKET